MSASPPRGTTVGVSGRPVRANVTPWGDVEPVPNGSSEAALAWFVAAEDRWHRPAEETSVRQERVSGTPVVETRLRVPGGDAVQRVWAVGDHGGMTIIEVHNDSPRAFAVAFSGLEVLTDRPPSDVPPKGIDLPAGAIVLPVGHHASVRVGIAQGGAGRRSSTRTLPPVPDADAVVRGWTSVTDLAGRLELPDDRLVHAMTAARSDLLLDGPCDAAADPTGFLYDVAQLVRLGEPAADWLPEIVGPAEAIARDPAPEVAAALRAAAGVVVTAGDRRAAADLERLLRRRDDDLPSPRVGFSELERGSSAGTFAHDVESLLVAGGALLAGGFATPWLGADLAVHDLPTAPGSTVGFAVRWHGDRPAVLWEQHGLPVTLTAPAIDPQWSTTAPSGEALWTAPPKRRPLRLTPES